MATFGSRRCSMTRGAHLACLQAGVMSEARPSPEYPRHQGQLLCRESAHTPSFT